MRAYIEAGLPELAVTQLSRCRAVLTEELGVEPLPETIAAAQVPTVAAAYEADGAVSVLRELERSQDELRRLSLLLIRSIHDLGVRQARMRSILERRDRPVIDS
jgi:hypothetical protein